MKIAVVGAGPAGFSFTSRVLKIAPHANINIFEKRSAPYGLVRYGVAPDHSEVRVRHVLNFNFYHLALIYIQSQSPNKIYMF
jgi:cation diffusion facilitator CzcD-associated flavoprotein CzcO